MAEPETHPRPEGDAPDAPAKDSPEPMAPVSRPPSVDARPPASRPSSKSSQPAAPAVPERASTHNRVSVKNKLSAEGGLLGAYEAVARSARLPDLVAVAQTIVAEAATARRAGTWDFSAKVAAAADDAKLSRADADTAFGNALKVLGSGPEGEAERALACALWAHAIAEARRDDEDRLSGDILWLATHTAFDATPLLDRALGEDADAVWKAIGERVRRVDEGKDGSLGRGEAIVGCASLAASESPSARKVVRALVPVVKDPGLARLLGQTPSGTPSARGATSEQPSAASTADVNEVRLEGEALPAPRGPVATALLALTGLLFAIHAVRLVARFALAYRKHAEVSLSDAGVRMKTRTTMLGRTLREHEHVIVRAGLVRVVREVRYPSASLYAGLLALALGSYLGVRALADGVRAASPSLLLTGLVIVALGIAADFVLGSLLPGSRGRVRIAFVPRAGAVLCVGDVDANRADDALARTLALR